MGTATSISRKEPINVMYYDNGCALAPYIHSVLGIGSGSASTSDQWLITLVPNTVNYLGTFLDKVFVKVIPNITDHADPYFKDMLRNVQREVQIYAEIIKPILDKRMCPYFLPVLNVSNNCTSTSVINMLIGKAPQVGYTRKVPDTYPTEPFNAEKIFIRNMVISTMSFEGGINDTPTALCFDEKAEMDQRNSFYPDKKNHVENLGFLKSFTTGDNIVSIHSQKNRECVDANRQKFLLETTYTMLYTVPIEGGETGGSLIGSLITSNNITGIYFYFFQLFIGLATMSWAKVFHNDLHEGNVLIQFLPKNEKFTYMVGFHVYTFSTNMIPIIFDFDKSIVAKLDTVTDRNIFYKDMWAMAYAYYTNPNFPPEVQNMFISCLFKPQFHQSVKTHLNRIRSRMSNFPYFDVGRRFVDLNLMAQATLDFDTIVKNWASAANVSYLSILDPRVTSILQLKDRKQYVTASYFFDETTGAITSSDPFTEFYLLVEESVQVDEKVDKEVIPKKQKLARQNLELLQLRLKLEKKPSRK